MSYLGNREFCMGNSVHSEAACLKNKMQEDKVRGGKDGKLISELHGL